MYILSLNTWFHTLIRQFFYTIDKLVFGFISTIYDLLMNISRSSILTQGDITQMSDRVYKLLIVFMVFKVTFSLIMYIVNPDDFSDKSKGVSKLGTNIIISLSLLILTPYVFRYAYELQAIIIEDGSLGALIFGDDKDTSKNLMKNAGDKIAYVAISPFLVPNTSIDALQNCVNLDLGDGKFNEECSGLKSGTYEELNKGMDSITDNSKFTSTMLQNYVAGFEHENFGLFFREDMVTATTHTDSDVFVMEYRFIFSTAVGIVIVLMLINFCMDIALRSVKLSFLQLIAPIPIISYVDPKSGKDGMFKKWYQLCFKTYLSLFIRLLALYFAIYIIGKVTDLGIVDLIDGTYTSNLLIKIFIIIGALMFAKQLPKILEGLGIKLDGDGKFFLNPLKKFEDQTLGGKRVTGAAGALTAGLADRAARIATTPGAKGKLKALAGSGPGVLASAFRGFSGNAGFKGGLDKQSQVNRRLREGRINGLSPTSSYLDYLGSKFGLDDATLESEGTFIRRNDDEIRKAKQTLDNKNRENTLNIEREKKDQTTRKNTKSKFDDTKTQGERLLKEASKFTVKKGDFDMGASHNANMAKLNMEMEQYKKAGMTEVSYDDGSGNTVNMSLDEMYARASRKINEKNYKSNRKADEANVKYLTDHNNETLTSTFMIGDQIFKAGTTIDGDVIARAQSAQEKYMKDSEEAVTNEMYRMINNQDTLSEEEKKFYKDNQSDFDSFSNITEEFNSSVDASNTAVLAYNSEYDTKITGIKSEISGGDLYKMVKSVNREMEFGNSVTEINKELSKSQTRVESWERQIEQNRKNTTVTYVDEEGRVSKTPIPLDEAESKNKARDEEHKHRLKQHQQRRSLMQDALSGKK
ncbi:MAG: hypothetical protein Q4E75_04005 [bacterium]|nr:hypothetical protein [bacterium]